MSQFLHVRSVPVGALIVRVIPVVICNPAALASAKDRMKFTRYLTPSFLISLILAAGALGQTTPKPTPVPNPNFDAALAKKLGADERGMRNYVLAILKSGPNYDKIKGDERSKIFLGHFANINRMAKDGTLLVAGPFGDDTGD